MGETDADSRYCTVRVSNHAAAMKTRTPCKPILFQKTHDTENNAGRQRNGKQFDETNKTNGNKTDD